MGLKGIFFDLFKTLGDHGKLVSDSDVSKLLRSKGYEVYPQAWKWAFGFVLFIEYPRIGFKTHEEIIQRTLEHLSVKVDKETIKDVATLYRKKPFTLYPESENALKTAKVADLKTCIVTSTPLPFFETGIKSIENYLDRVYTGFEVGFEKSNPRIFLKIADEMNLKPYEVAVIGDDPLLDIQNSKNLGFNTIQITKNDEQSDCTNAMANNVLEAVKIAIKWI